MNDEHDHAATMSNFTPRPAVGIAEREPAIDGLRALCVVAVVVYHLPAAWLPGGFLAVSTFFTLSGFLITRLVLDELSRTGRFRPVRFTARRLRRLMPAAAVVAAVSVAAWSVSGRSIPTGDTAAALTYLSNWWHLGTGQGYAELFGSPSPFQHYWSLAIEEQFYLVFPVAAWGLYRLTRGRIGTFAAVLTLAITASLAVSATSSFDAAYYGTHTRAGRDPHRLAPRGVAVVAPGHSGRSATRRQSGRRPRRRVGVVGLVVIWTTVELGSPCAVPLGHVRQRPRQHGGHRRMPPWPHRAFGAGPATDGCRSAG